MTAAETSIQVVTDWGAARERWRAIAARGHAGVFQQTAWLDAWFATIGASSDITPLLVFLRGDHGDRAALPLVLRRSEGLSVVEFVDGGVTDYAAPVFAPDVDPAGLPCADLWRKIHAALPPADIVSLRNMPVQVAGRSNALAHAKGSFPSGATGHVLNIPDDWAVWRKRVGRFFRKEIDRSRRVFERNEGARFERVTNLARARQVYEALRALQSERMTGRADYTLEEPAKIDFYWRLIRDNLDRGYAVLTALSAGEEFAGVLLGVASGRSYAMLRLAPAGGKWANCSPGRLIIERTMRHLHEQGYRTFDFTIGAYDYKRRFAVEALPLRDIALAGSLRGLPFTAEQRLRGLVRARPALKRAIDRLRGRTVEPNNADA